MIVTVRYEDSDYVYDIDLNKVLKYVPDVTEEQFMSACSKVVAQS